MKNNQIVTDLLWSGCGGERNLGYESKKLNDDEIECFLEENVLDMLINTKDGLANGVEEGKCVLSVFSVPSYSKMNNNGSILRINKNLSVIPHVLKSSSSHKALWVSEQQSKTSIQLSE